MKGDERDDIGESRDCEDRGVAVRQAEYVADEFGEQWLGWPVDESYLAASGVVHAGKLRGKLLMVVGEQDSNVDPASTMQVVDALIRADKDFELLVIPNGEHGAGRTNGPVPYGQRRMYDFFLRTLQGQGLRDWNHRVAAAR